MLHTRSFGEERRRYAQDALDYARVAVDDSRVKEKVPAAKRIAEILERYTLVEIEAGEVVVPRWYKRDNEALPLVVLFEGESLHIPPPLFLPTSDQWAQIRKGLQAHPNTEKAPNAWEMLFRSQAMHGEGRNIEYEHGTFGMTRTRIEPIGPSNPNNTCLLRAKGRPCTALFISPRKSTHDNAYTLIHEAQHVDDVISEPFYDGLEGLDDWRSKVDQRHSEIYRTEFAIERLASPVVHQASMAQREFEIGIITEELRR